MTFLYNKKFMYVRWDYFFILDMFIVYKCSLSREKETYNLLNI